jgi:DNA (cytosine-5)-methyltransferase 1
MDLAAAQGLKVSRDAVNLPTPAVNDMKRGKTVEQWDEWTDKMKSKHGNGNGHGPSLDIEVLRLMPTPNTMDHLPARSAEKIAESKERTPGGYANIRETVVNDLMPTPKALDGIKGNLKTSQERIDAGHFVDLTNVAIDLAPNLPTPTASDWKGANHSGSGSASSRGMATVVEQTNWGKFEPAIRRWEAVMDRPAPAPTLPDGKEGAHRLSPWFTEWMMGLPEGWICDPEIGLTRNEQLKACGNGVVAQQAELALRILLEGVDFSLGGGQVNLPTPTVSDTFTSNLKSTQQKEGSMHSVTLPQAVERLVENCG